MPGTNCHSSPAGIVPRISKTPSLCSLAFTGRQQSVPSFIRGIKILVVRKLLVIVREVPSASKAPFPHEIELRLEGDRRTPLTQARGSCIAKRQSLVRAPLPGSRPFYGASLQSETILHSRGNQWPTRHCDTPRRPCGCRYRGCRGT